MSIQKIAFATYAVTDVKRARDFYENILGLKPDSVWEGDGMAFIEYSFGEQVLAIGMGAPNFVPGKNGATVALEVDDFDKTVADLRSKKVTFAMEPLDSGVCHMAIINDTEGNQLMIHKKK